MAGPARTCGIVDACRAIAFGVGGSCSCFFICLLRASLPFHQKARRARAAGGSSLGRGHHAPGPLMRKRAGEGENLKPPCSSRKKKDLKTGQQGTNICLNPPRLKAALTSTD